MFRALLDTGGSHSMMHMSCLPRGVTPKVLNQPRHTKTIAGSIDTSRYVYLEDLHLPEFDKSRTIDGITVFLFNAPCAYDIILGRDFLHKTGIEMSFQQHTVTSLDRNIDMKSPEYWNVYTSWLVALDLDEDMENDDDSVLNQSRFLSDDYQNMHSYATDSLTKILDAKYEAVTAEQVAKQLKHLDDKDKQLLQQLLANYEKMFDGKLARYPHTKVHLELEEGATPFHKRAYPVSQVHIDTFKRELQHRWCRNRLSVVELINL